MLFSARSVLHLNQLGFCLKRFLALFDATTKSNPSEKTNKTIVPKLYKIEEFEQYTFIDTINMFKLLEFVKASKLAHKLQGFVEHYGSNLQINEQRVQKHTGLTQFLHVIKSKDTLFQDTISVADTSSNNEERTSNPLMAIVNFLECLKSNCLDGRIYVLPGPTIGQGIIKFLLLNPAAHFHDIGTVLINI